MSDLPLINTSCRDCVFAQWQDNIQVGCLFDRIQKFADNGAQVIPQKEEDKQYFMILGRFCNACRDGNWGKMHSRRKWKKDVIDAMQVQLDIIINVDGYVGLMQIMDTVNSAYDQEIKPKSVVVAVNPEYDYMPIVDIVAEMKNEARGLWRVEKLKTENAAKFCSGTFYSIFNAGYTIPNNFISLVNNSINVELNRFVALLPDDGGNGLTILNMIARQCSGDIDKIVKTAQETNQDYMIKRYEDLCMS